MSNAEDARLRAQYEKALKAICEMSPWWASKKIIELEADQGERENDPLVARMREQCALEVKQLNQLSYTQREEKTKQADIIERLANAIRALEGR